MGKKGFLRALSLLLMAVLLSGVLPLLVSAVEDADVSPLWQKYAHIPNGTILKDEGVLVFYTVSQLQDLYTGALSSNRLFGTMERGDVLASLPFSEDAGRGALEKYETGAWYLLDVIESQYDSPGEAPAETSKAYLVTDRGLTGLVFIFVPKNGEEFSVHIDTSGTNTMATSKITEYDEVANQPEQSIPAQSSEQPVDAGGDDLGGDDVSEEPVESEDPGFLKIPFATSPRSAPHEETTGQDDIEIVPLTGPAQSPPLNSGILVETGVETVLPETYGLNMRISSTRGLLIGDLIIVDEPSSNLVDPPEDLEWGQIWSGKNVVPIKDAPGKFAVTLYASGRLFYTDDTPTTRTYRNPLHSNTDLVITDIIGEQFTFVGLKSDSTLPEGTILTIPEDPDDLSQPWNPWNDPIVTDYSGPVRWTIPGDNFDPNKTNIQAKHQFKFQITFIIQLKPDRPEPEGEYEYLTNVDADARFTPSHGDKNASGQVINGTLPLYNPYYYGGVISTNKYDLELYSNRQGEGKYGCFLIPKRFFIDRENQEEPMELKGNKAPPDPPPPGWSYIYFTANNLTSLVNDNSTPYTTLLYGYYGHDPVNGLVTSPTPTADCPYYFAVYDDYNSQNVKLIFYSFPDYSGDDLVIDASITNAAGTTKLANWFRVIVNYNRNTQHVWEDFLEPPPVGDSQKVVLQMNNPGISRTAIPLSIKKIDADKGFPLVGIEFDLFHEGDENPITTLTTDDCGRAEIPWKDSAGNYLHGDFYLVELEPPDGYMKNDPIYFTIELFQGYRPYISDVTPEGIAYLSFPMDYDDGAGSFPGYKKLIIKNKPIKMYPAIKLEKELIEDEVYNNAHGDAIFLFEVRKYADDNGTLGNLMDTWVWSTTFPPPSGGSHETYLEGLEWDCWYEIVEIPNMRYGVSDVDFVLEDSDKKPLGNQGYYELKKNGNPTGYSALFFMEYNTDIYDDTNNGELVVHITFRNVREYNSYLSDSSIKTNEIIIATPAPTNGEGGNEP